MRQSKNRRLARALFTAAVVGIGGMALAQAVEELFVGRPSLPIRAGKGGAYNTVATAKQNDKLNIVAREGNWIKVQYGDKQGYVLATALSANPIKGDALRSGLAGGADAGGLEAGAAGKGLTPEAEGYAKTKGMDPKIVQQMIDRNSAVTGEWEAFQQAGNVGPERKQ